MSPRMWFIQSLGSLRWSQPTATLSPGSSWCLPKMVSIKLLLQKTLVLESLNSYGSQRPLFQATAFLPGGLWSHLPSLHLCGLQPPLSVSQESGRKRRFPPLYSTLRSPLHRPCGVQFSLQIIPGSWGSAFPPFFFFPNLLYSSVWLLNLQKANFSWIKIWKGTTAELKNWKNGKGRGSTWGAVGGSFLAPGWQKMNSYNTDSI